MSEVKIHLIHPIGSKESLHNELIISSSSLYHNKSLVFVIIDESPPEFKKLYIPISNIKYIEEL
jgi:hypothetical protein